MKLEDAMKLRDETIIGTIVHSFPAAEQENVRSTVRAAFKKASEVWIAEILPNLVGQEGQKQFLRRLQRDITADLT